MKTTERMIEYRKLDYMRGLPKFSGGYSVIPRKNTLEIYEQYEGIWRKEKEKKVTVALRTAPNLLKFVLFAYTHGIKPTIILKALGLDDSYFHIIEPYLKLRKFGEHWASGSLKSCIFWKLEMLSEEYLDIVNHPKSWNPWNFSNSWLPSNHWFKLLEYGDSNVLGWIKGAKNYEVENILRGCADDIKTYLDKRVDIIAQTELPKEAIIKFMVWYDGGEWFSVEINHFDTFVYNYRRYPDAVK